MFAFTLYRPVSPVSLVEVPQDQVKLLSVTVSWHYFYASIPSLAHYRFVRDLQCAEVDECSPLPVSGASGT